MLKLKEEIFEKITDLLNNDYVINKEITKKDNLSDIGLDSLDIVELTINLERIYDISISDNEIENLENIDDFVNVIYDKLI